MDCTQPAGSEGTRICLSIHQKACGRQIAFKWQTNVRQSTSWRAKVRPAQCKALVFAICLTSMLKGLKKPPPALHSTWLSPCHLQVIPTVYQVALGGFLAGNLYIVTSESLHKEACQHIHYAYANEGDNLQGPLC